ncbi:MAG: P-loop NTPase [Candidatus Aenigmatarchaeota archaeon]
MVRVIGIFSGKGGVGKTTLAINISSALLKFGVESILVDADIKMCGASLQLNMQNYPITLSEVLSKDMSIFDAIYTHISGIKVVPCSFLNEPLSLSSLQKVLSNPYLSDRIVLIDTPPGITQEVIEIVNSCNEAILVVTPEITSIASSLKILKLIKEKNLKFLGVVVNRYLKNLKNQIPISEIEKTFDSPILGVVPEDENIRRSVNERLPSFFLNPNCESSISFEEISSKLLGIPYQKKKSFLDKLF